MAVDGRRWWAEAAAVVNNDGGGRHACGCCWGLELRRRQVLHVLPQDGPRCCCSSPPPRRASRPTPFGHSSATTSTKPAFTTARGGYGEPTARGSWRKLMGLVSSVMEDNQIFVVVVSAHSPLVNLLCPRAPVASIDATRGWRRWPKRPPWHASAACSCTTANTSGGAATVPKIYHATLKSK